MSETTLVVIDAKRSPWTLARYVGRHRTDKAELIVPARADSSEIAALIERFRADAE